MKIILKFVWPLPKWNPGYVPEGSLIQLSIANREQRAKEKDWLNAKSWRTPNHQMIHYTIFLCLCTKQLIKCHYHNMQWKIKYLYQIVSQTESDLLNLSHNSFQQLNLQQNVYDQSGQSQSLSTWSYGGSSSATSHESATSETSDNQSGIIHFINSYTE